MSAMRSPLEIIFSMKQKNVIVQLKNGFNIRGLLEDVDYFLNLKLSNVIATDKNINIFKRANAVFLRGNLISSIVLEKGNLNTKLINNSKEQKNKVETKDNNINNLQELEKKKKKKKRVELKKKYKYKH